MQDIVSRNIFSAFLYLCVEVDGGLRAVEYCCPEKFPAVFESMGLQ
jgi:hypothetical protein